MELELSDKEAVYKSDNRADRDDREEHEPERHYADSLEHLARVACHLKQGSRDARRQTDAASRRNIGTRKNYTSGDAERYRQLCRRQRYNIDN